MFGIDCEFSKDGVVSAVAVVNECGEAVCQTLVLPPTATSHNAGLTLQQVFTLSTVVLLRVVCSGKVHNWNHSSSFLLLRVFEFPIILLFKL